MGGVTPARGGIYDEIWRVAEALVAKAEVRSRLHRIDKVGLDKLYSLRAGSIKNGDYDKAISVSLEIVRREIAAARKEGLAKEHAKVVLALVLLLRLVARAKKGADGAARSMAAGLVVGISPRPEWLKKYVENAPKKPREAVLVALTGMSLADWNAFVVRVVEATAGRMTPGSVVGGAEPGAVDLDVAARLSRLAAREKTKSVDLPKYDLSDRNVRISRVTVSGFRGSSGTVTLDLRKNDKPADVLLWGDNGVGKSTLIDGIEFALQHRVDRSTDFNSSLRSSVRNLSVPAAHADVELSDGSVIERSLVTNKAGRDEPSSLDVRPGFRIAPVVIRRADILRFLDTDALNRGTVFFDYFPDPLGTLGVRPDEELRGLEEERFLLRVAKDDLAAQLTDIYPDAGVDFTDSTKLETFVGKLLASLDTSEYEQPIDALPADARQIITELRSAQQRSSAIRKKLAGGVQTLNPIAYRSQLTRIVPILLTVTGNLTDSFKRITRASHVTAIRVLVAKSGPVSLDVVVEFDNGKSALPQQAFSEGYKDLIALLFFLTVTKKAAEFGQAKILVLDDALQSVDATIRVGVMDFILNEFKDWQLIVTGHDRAWLAQLRSLFQRRGRSFAERNITGWSFAGGIEVGGVSQTRAASLREAVHRVDERMAAAGTGLLLEEISAELSWRLMAGVTRREGDRYTLGDLWPGVAKALKSTTLKATVDEISLRVEIRNLLGAHYNEWADGIAWSDVRQLAEDVLAVYDATYCAVCANWVRKQGSRIACTCGTLDLS
ncbi:hypothetical protein [Kribbella sp. NPDC051620]|uniref:hypothetical protein n=1 Tax=Kribbella sp. NPDC051620 TaxID=3364120 RepID=UPI0037B25D64